MWALVLALFGTGYGVEISTQISTSGAAPGAVTGLKVSDAAMGKMGPWKWTGGAAIGNVDYFAPSSAQCMLQIDTESNNVTCLDTNFVSSGPWKWVGCDVDKSQIICAPSNADKILSVNVAENPPKLDSISIQPDKKFPDRENSADSSYKYRGTVVYKNKFIFGPYTADDIMVYDPETHETSYVSDDEVFPPDSKGAKWKVYEGTVVGDSAYFCPAGSIQKILTVGTNGTELVAGGIDIPESFQSQTGNKANWRGIVGVPETDSFYLIPYSATNVLKYDTAKKEFKAIQVVQLEEEATEKWFGGVAVPACDAIAMAPYNAKTLLIVDTKTDTPSTIDVKDVWHGAQKWIGGVAVDTKAFFAPFFADSVLVWDCKAAGGSQASSLLHAAPSFHALAPPKLTKATVNFRGEVEQEEEKANEFDQYLYHLNKN